MTLNERLFLFADATAQLIAARIRWALTGARLASLYARRYFLETYYGLRGGFRG